MSCIPFTRDFSVIFTQTEGKVTPAKQRRKETEVSTKQCFDRVLTESELLKPIYISSSLWNEPPLPSPPAQEIDPIRILVSAMLCATHTHSRNLFINNFKSKYMGRQRSRRGFSIPRELLAPVHGIFTEHFYLIKILFFHEPWHYFPSMERVRSSLISEQTNPLRTARRSWCHTWPQTEKGMRTKPPNLWYPQGRCEKP